MIEPGKGSLERMAAEADVDHLFIKLLRRLADQGRNVSDEVSPSYAPSVFANEPEAKSAKTDKKAFAEAMARLFTLRKIRVEAFGPASKMRSKVVETEGRSNDPSNDVPTTSQLPPNGVCAHTPHTPPTVGNGQGGVGRRPARPNGQEGEGNT